ncbi:MAG: type II toxin-antitoxin system HigB family toxin [Acidobacteriota bacterium]
MLIVYTIFPKYIAVLDYNTGTYYIGRCGSSRRGLCANFGCVVRTLKIPSWRREVEKEDWTKPSEVKDKYRSASFVGDRVVFNIKGNDYRLVVKINYPHRIVYVRFVGTHKEYDEIDVKEM